MSFGTLYERLYCSIIKMTSSWKIGRVEELELRPWRRVAEGEGTTGEHAGQSFIGMNRNVIKATVILSRPWATIFTVCHFKWELGTIIWYWYFYLTSLPCILIKTYAITSVVVDMEIRVSNLFQHRIMDPRSRDAEQILSAGQATDSPVQHL